MDHISIGEGRRLGVPRQCGDARIIRFGRVPLHWSVLRKIPAAERFLVLFLFVGVIDKVQHIVEIVKPIRLQVADIDARG
jgi:hypothetical protein